jgi:hypothetical protein
VPNLQAAVSRFARTCKVTQASAHGLERLAQQCERLEEFTAKAKLVHERVTKRLVGSIRAMLAENFSKSGVGTLTPEAQYHHTGRLRQAAVNSALCEATARGIRISFGPGFPDDVYVRGGALNYGAVRAPMKKMARVDLPTGHILAATKRSVLGARAKRSLKKAAFAGTAVGKRTRSYLEEKQNVVLRRPDKVYTRNKGDVDTGSLASRKESDTSVRMGSVTVIKPHRFFYLNDAQIAELQEQYVQLWQEELDRLLGAGATTARKAG